MGLPLWAEEKPLRAVIDAEVQAVWQREKIQPARLAEDPAFLRRVFLDLVGTIPTLEETKQFLQDGDPKKREKTIDNLLADPRFAEQQAAVWDLVFFGRHLSDYDLLSRRDGFRKWLTAQFAGNVPYDRWVRDLLAAEGNTNDAGPAMYYAQYRNQPEEAAMAVSRVFLGVQLQCARCHDHPFDKWKQVDFYGLAAFFARMVFVESSVGGRRHYLIGEKSTGEVLFTGPAIEQKPGQKGKPVPAKFLEGKVLDEPPLPKGFKEPDLRGGKVPPKPLVSRKAKLAEWVTAADNPYFARAAVNRIWAQFLGRGLVHPMDDLSDKRSPSHPALLKTLAKQFVAHKFDLRWLIRELVSSQTYQLADAGAGTEALPAWFARARVRPLSAEELMASLRTATGADPKQNALGGDGREYVLMFFGEPTSGRGEFQASLSEHLFLNNSQHLRRLILPRKGNLADRILQSKAPWEERVDQLFLSILTRPPRTEERERFVAHFASGPKPEPLLEEAMWALLNASEFRFNH